MKKMLFLGSVFLLLGFSCSNPTDDITLEETPESFAETPTRRSFEVYFIDSDSQGFDCSVVDFEKRTVEAETGVETFAILELIEGPESDWAMTSVPTGTTLRSLSIDDGVAHVDFGALDINTWSGGACFVTSLRSQIEHTLLQFDSIDSVVISVNGESEEILQP